MVVRLADPEPSRVPVPSVTVPSKNVAEPVGTAVPDTGTTFALNTIVAPVAAVEGPVNVVVVATRPAALTEMESGETETLGLKLESPPY